MLLQHSLPIKFIKNKILLVTKIIFKKYNLQSYFNLMVLYLIFVIKYDYTDLNHIV